MTEEINHTASINDNRNREIEINLQEKLCRNDLEQIKGLLTKDEAVELEGVTDNFLKVYRNFLRSHTIKWNEISAPPSDMILNIEKLPSVRKEEINKLLDKLVVLKLNGGLGTTMGCCGPKSLIEIREGKSFLDLTMEQIEWINTSYGCDIPLILMNSYNTKTETERVLESCRQRYKISIFTFEQHRYPRIDQESLRPIKPIGSLDSAHIWYPPGHGDLYDAFWHSNVFKELLKKGKEIIFVSNIDNLGATINFEILSLMLCQNEQKRDFIMEVTPKTRADIKGGTLISYRNKLKLLEYMQVPSDHIEDFKSLKKFKIFNTNNIWFNMKSLEEKMSSKYNFDLDVIVNKKTIISSRHIIQLETAVASAIANFEHPIGVVVPRSRFLPVKNNSDLFLIKSNLYHLKNGRLLTNENLYGFHSTPLVKFVGKNFQNVKEFLSRFGTIPDILELEHLTVSGDVTFGKNVTLKGTVIIIANAGERIDIPSGAILENKIITGSLKITEY